MSPEFVRCEVKDYIALVTLDRPPVNALNLQAYEELAQAFNGLNGREDVLVAILTGAGQRAFSVGGDARELAARTPQTALERTRKAGECLWAIYDCEVPVIAAINGLALGGGLMLAASCDILIASEKAALGLPEINVGVIGGAGHLARLMSHMKARKMLYTAERIDAQEAYRLGAVEKVVPPAELISEAMKLAREIANKSPRAIRLAKKALNQIEYLDLRQGYRVQEEFNARFLAEAGANAQELSRAFLEKRPPKL